MPSLRTPPNLNRRVFLHPVQDFVGVTPLTMHVKLARPFMLAGVILGGKRRRCVISPNGCGICHNASFHLQMPFRKIHKKISIVYDYYPRAFNLQVVMVGCPGSSFLPWRGRIIHDSQNEAPDGLLDYLCAGHASLGRCKWTGRDGQADPGPVY